MAAKLRDPSDPSAAAGPSILDGVTNGIVPNGDVEEDAHQLLQNEEADLRRKIATLQRFHATAAASKANGLCTLGSLMNHLAVELIDELTREVIFEMHRTVKLRLRCLCSKKDLESPGHIHTGIVDVPGYDIFGKQPLKNSIPTFPCPSCGSVRQPAKFASHLEKCLGMGGRESKRVTARRLATQTEMTREKDDAGDPDYDPDARKKRANTKRKNGKTDANKRAKAKT